jgi:Zn-dependent protease with chaperone function
MKYYDAIFTGGDRKSIQIFPEKDGFRIKGLDQFSYISYRECHLKAGGNQNSLLMVESTVYPELKFYCSDTTIWKDPDLKLSFPNEFQKFQKSSFSHFVLIVVFTFLIASPILGIIFFRSPLIRLIANGISPEKEKAIGDKIWDIYKKDKTILSNKTSVKVSEEFLNRLKFDPKFHIKIHIVEDSIVNAFALPGGHIILNSGLILNAETPEEIAGVLSHEISHITQRHVLRQMIQMIGVYGGLSIIVGDVGGALATILQGSAFFLQMKFSQDFETEADSEGIRILVESQVSPLGLQSFLEKIKKKEEDTKILEEQEKVLEFFQTHPNTSSRIEFIQNWSKINPNFKGRPFLFSLKRWKDEIKNSGEIR